MMMYLPIIIFLILSLGLNANGSGFYLNYTVIYNPLKSLEWSNDRALIYITTVRLFNSDHHVFQYRRYPCQYFYTDEIQMNYNNETSNQCIYNTGTSDYGYNFQLHLDSRHVEPYILRNLAIQCKYINCSLSLLTMKSIRIGWNLRGGVNNINCSFDALRSYGIHQTPETLSDWITLRCKSLFACNRSKYNLEKELTSNVQLIYGSAYELATPYCSLEKNIAHLIETNFGQTHRLLEQLVQIIQRGFGKPDDREQAQMKEFIEQKLTSTESTSTTSTTAISGQAQGTFIRTK